MKNFCRLGLFALLLLTAQKGNTQIGGAFTVPGTFSSIAAAINTLNTVGIAAPVTINIAAGYTETAVPGGYTLFSVTGISSTNTILFQKSGVGANPLIIAYTGTATPASAAHDGIWTLKGSDYITIDGIDILDPNTSNPATMEFGYRLYPLNTGNGCQYNTIQNCVITLNRNNSAYAGVNSTGGSKGIEVIMGSSFSNTAVSTPTAAAGTNSYNRFYNNVIRNCHVGIAITGNISSGYFDVFNDVGGSSAATSNTIINFGGGPSNASYGVCTLAQYSLNVSYNVINNNDGSGADPLDDLMAIRTGTSSGGNISINNNTITLSCINNSTVELNGIYNEAGSFGTVTINNNIFPSYNYTNSNVNAVNLIKTFTVNVLNVKNNLIQNVNIKDGLLFMINTGLTKTISITSNTISGVTGGLYCNAYGLAFQASVCTVSNNAISDFTVGNGVHAIDGGSSAFSTAISDNTVHNVATMIFWGINSGSYSSTRNISGNQIFDVRSLPSSTTGLYFRGIFCDDLSGTSIISSNQIYSITSISSAPANPVIFLGINLDIGLNVKVSRNKVGHIYANSTGTMIGINAIGSSSYDLQNNVVGDFDMPNCNTPLGLVGIRMDGTSGSVASYNSVYLNSSSSGNYTNTSCAFLSSTPYTLTLRNNIFVNTSAFGGASIAGSIGSDISNINKFYASSGNNILYAGTPSNNRPIFFSTSSTYSTLALFKAAAAPGETQSRTELPPFITTDGSNPNFLNIDPLVHTQVADLGVPVSGITNDYANNTRSSTTPDIGAWEGTFTQADVATPQLSSTGYANSNCNLSGRTVTMAVTDFTGVATGSLNPKMYYRVNLGIYTSAQGTLTSGSATNGVWSFALTYSANPNDVINYFAGFHDISYVNNFTLFPSNGAVATDVNNITTTPFPTYSFAVGSSTAIGVNSGAICSGGIFTLQPYGAQSYTFSSGSATVSPTTTTSYTVTGINTNGCPSNLTVVATVSVVNTSTISVNSGTICSGQTFTIQPTGASTYTYQGGSAIVSPNVSTSYSVVGSNGPGCNSSNTVTAFVTVNASPTITVNSGSLCTGNIFTITPTGAANYLVSGGSFTVSPVTTSSYAVVGTSTAGCISNTAISNVTVAVTPTIAVNNTTLCEGSSYTIVPTGAFNYSYSSGSAVVSPTVTSSYTVTGKSAAGCESSNTVVATVSVFARPVISVNSGSICSGKSFTILPSGTDFYSVAGGNFTVSPLTSTVYAVTGTNSLGCVSLPVSATVQVSASPTIAMVNGTVCAGNIYTLNPTGAFAYNFSSGSATIQPSATASYTISGVSAAGCVSTNTLVRVVTVNPLPTVSVNSGSICSGKSFTLLPSGATSYVYQGGSAIVSPNVSTTYTVSGSSGGCLSASTATATVTVFASPVITVNSGSICSGQSFTFNTTGTGVFSYPNGSVVVNPAGTTQYTITSTSVDGCISNKAVSTVVVQQSPTITIANSAVCAGSIYTLQPSGAANYVFSSGSATVQPVTTTSYSITGSSSAGCPATNTAIATVSINSLPVISVNNGTICSGAAFTITPSGATTYSIQGGSAVVNPQTTTSYSIVGISAQGCISSNTVSAIVNVNPSPTITVNSGSICAGGVFTFQVTGAGNFNLPGGSNTISPIQTSTYVISSTSSLGCTSNTMSSVIIVHATPTVVVNSGSICSGNVFTFNPTGAGTFIYLNGAQTVSPVSNTTYSITGMSAQGCMAQNTAVATVSVFTTPTISVSGGSICSGQSFVFNPTGAPNYSYTGGSATVTPLNTSNYTITGYGANGCISSPATVTVNVSSTPTIAVNSGSICSGQIFTFNVNGGGTISYQGGSPTVSPLSNSTYTIVSTSSAGCISNIITSSVIVNTTPTITAGNGTICAGQQFTLNPSGASSYSVNGNNLVVSPLSSTVYIITGLSNGCMSSPVTSSVTVIPVPTISVNSGSICAGQVFQIVPSGAATYSYSGGSATVSPPSTTNFTVTGYNSAGCAGNPVTLAVTVYSLPLINISQPLLLCGGVSQTLTASGASSYSWTTGALTASTSVAPLINTTYTVTGWAQSMCSNIATVEVTVKPVPTLTVASNNVLICTGDSVVLSAGGVQTLTWSAGVTNNVPFYPTLDNTYTVSSLGANGCKATQTVEVSILPGPTVTVVQPNPVICEGMSVTLTGSGANTYSWSTGNITPKITVSPTTTTIYILTGIDINGCKTSVQVTQSVESCLSLADNAETPQIIIYPNPGSGIFAIRTGELKGELHLEIYDTRMQLIAIQILSAESSIVDLREKANGLYLFRLITNGNVIGQQRVIKN